MAEGDPGPKPADCAVCFGRLVGDGRHGKVEKQRGCEHYFHSGCVREWARRKRARGERRPGCPLCREELKLQPRVKVAKL